jgi:hypothetical protein
MELPGSLSILDFLFQNKNFLFGFEKGGLKLLFFGDELLESAEFLINQIGFFNPDFTGQVALDFRQLIGVHYILEVVDEFLQVVLGGQ